MQRFGTMPKPERLLVWQALRHTKSAAAELMRAVAKLWTGADTPVK
jgi:hypothetical protein